MSKKGTATASRISDQYRREPRFVMTWKRLRTNVGAIIGLVLLLILILAMIYSFIFVSYEDITKMNGNADECIIIQNPMSLNFRVVRPSVLPSLLRLEAESQNAAYPHLVFECGKICIKDKI